MATSYNKIISRNLHLPLAQAVAFRSVSHNPYVNISLDDWFYQNYPLRSQHYPLLYLYRNHPCIVIGRHQNPWTECNSKLVGIYPDQVPLVRRRSGGGAVYHPEISGSASRLGRLVAYHHFTLLFHSKLQQLAQMLTPHTNGLRSNATASVRSSVINLSQINNAITYDNLCSKIASTFTKTFHPKINNEELLDINPNTESNYPGIASLRNELKSWDWIYGKTPDFEIHQSSNLSMGKVVCMISKSL
ncbi:uncharacterized protein TRIADDRAFT_51631 [Trichoplax adhaerens]|uniref:BPL/LPL catalytic domain-containing protein n=1 Tax=Trichoplax adhaerens TaxID=10228 RepID=B3RK56_TRIAD|nr:hypothetical protein TRIADDRAFT_51631 [Trichoplax adhaerens]EDV29382.1 hypothetical protein TRIADDRAFT_51631 [Trichoplax adhaerens]|eukprot:XP_002108584.1 hypothetical protein TRIADDRAFT_51631 [Trichoplax adhaerens]